MQLIEVSGARLSVKQADILHFIKDFVREEGYAPSIREIQEGCGISSSSVVAFISPRAARTA